MSTSALIGLKPIARSRFCIHSGEGPLVTPRTSRKAKAGQRCCVGGGEIEMDAGRAVECAGVRFRRGRLQLAEPGRGEIARDSGDASRVGTVRRHRDVDDGIVEPGVVGVSHADRRVVGQFDDAVVILAELELGRRAEHAVRTRRRG